MLIDRIQEFPRSLSPTDSLALGAGGTFRTTDISEHTRTNAAIIARFLGDVVNFTKQPDRTWFVTVRGRES